MINLFISKLLLLVFVSFSFLLAGQDRAYQLFDSQGKVMSYNKMIRLLKKKDVVFFGEYHDNPVCHWLQLEMSKSLIHERDSKIIFGAEFFVEKVCLLIRFPFPKWERVSVPKSGTPCSFPKDSHYLEEPPGTFSVPKMGTETGARGVPGWCAVFTSTGGRS